LTNLLIFYKYLTELFILTVGALGLPLFSTGDPSRYHSFYIAVCLDHDKSLSVLDLASLGRLGTTVKKTTLLCSVDVEGHVHCTSLQWSGIS